MRRVTCDEVELEVPRVEVIERGLDTVPLLDEVLATGREYVERVGEVYVERESREAVTPRLPGT